MATGRGGGRGYDCALGRAGVCVLFEFGNDLSGLCTDPPGKGRGGNRSNALRIGWTTELGSSSVSAALSKPARGGLRQVGANGRRARSRSGSSRCGGKKRGTPLGSG